jgi:hypothetical protein
VEALIVDVENELKFIAREIEILKRKKERVETEREPENLDSHVKAIALTLHSIYTGYEKILEMLIKGIDGDAPTATDYHTALLKRATYTIPGVRPEIISERLSISLMRSELTDTNFAEFTPISFLRVKL